MNIYKILLFILFALLGLGLSGIAGLWFAPQEFPFDRMQQWSFFLAFLFSVIVLLSRSSIFRSRALLLIVPGLLIGLTGTVFKLLHWPDANGLLLLGFLLVLLGYNLRFIIRALDGGRDRQAVLRWSFVTSYCTILPAVIMHWLDRQWANVPSLILYATVIDQLLSWMHAPPKPRSRSAPVPEAEITAPWQDEDLFE